MTETGTGHLAEFAEGRRDLGIFARVFPAQPAPDLASTISEHGFTAVQLNLVALGLPTMPDRAAMASIDFAEIATAFRQNGVRIWGLSATYNMAHPDPAVRRDLGARAVAMIERAPELGVEAISLCTGTRDPDNQWRFHPDNDTAAAWDDMMESFAVLAPAAQKAGVRLAVEPEPANVIRDADAGVRLLDALDSAVGDAADTVGFILDPANLVAEHDPSTYTSVLDDAFNRLGARTICVHAKDVVTWRERLAGKPGLDFVHISRLLGPLPTTVPLIIQDTEPADVAPARQLLVSSVAAARTTNQMHRDSTR